MPQQRICTRDRQAPSTHFSSSWLPCRDSQESGAARRRRPLVAVDRPGSDPFMATRPARCMGRMHAPARRSSATENSFSRLPWKAVPCASHRCIAQRRPACQIAGRARPGVQPQRTGTTAAGPCGFRRAGRAGRSGADLAAERAAGASQRRERGWRAGRPNAGPPGGARPVRQRGSGPAQRRCLDMAPDEHSIAGPVTGLTTLLPRPPPALSGRGLGFGHRPGSAASHRRSVLHDQGPGRWQGSGLPLAHGIVADLGGGLQMRSEPGHGGCSGECRPATPAVTSPCPIHAGPR